MKKNIFVFIILIGLLITSGCNNEEKLGEGSWELKGTVISVNENTVAISSQDNEEIDYYVNINDDTKYFKNVDENIELGNIVVFEINFVMESYPMQTTAISVIENSK